MPVNELYVIICYSELVWYTPSLGNQVYFSHHQYTRMVHSGLTMFAMTDQNAVYLAIATIPPSVIGIWYLSLPKVNLTVIVHYFVHEQGVNKHSLQWLACVLSEGSQNWRGHTALTAMEWIPWLQKIVVWRFILVPETKKNWTGCQLQTLSCDLDHWTCDV